MTDPRLGPVTAATIMTADLDDSTGLYARALGLNAGERRAFAPREAEACGWPGLAGAPTVWMSNTVGESWLRFIEHPRARRTRPFTHHGWVSLEISVADVDRLADDLAGSGFEIIGPPADLAMSDAIRAMQVAGPSGEVLYLTQIKRDVPPFELPRARCAVDRLFIPVMLCPERNAALHHYSALSGNEGLYFMTTVTVLNGALGRESDHETPIATLQLAGNTLLEIDEVPGLDPAPFADDDPPTGIAFVHFQLPGSPPRIATGASGERYLINPNH